MSTPVLTQNKPDSYAALRLPEFRSFLLSRVFATLAITTIFAVLRYQVYDITKDSLALGWLGLVEAIPALSLALIGGYFADRHDRRKIVLITGIFSIICAASFALASTLMTNTSSLVLVLYAIIFITGIANGFANPAMSAFDAQIVPRAMYMNASSWTSSVGQTCSIIGPPVAGFALYYLGAPTTYTVAAVLLCLAVFFISQISPKPKPIPEAGETMRQSIAAGAKYVAKSQPLLGSMALDLFAVLFGGAIALLPVFASDVLGVDARGYGLLLAAPSVGALVIMLISTRKPPIHNAGRNLLVCVAGFGISMIVFALSKNFVLSFIALAFSGIFDGISMVIRSAIVRMLSPENMRGRIASVSWIFIGASNELGAFESGVAARLLGTVPSVFWGGVVTLLVVSAVTWLAPQLRTLRLDPQLHGED